MLKLTLLRLLGIIPTVFLVASATFFLTLLNPVSPADVLIGQNATPAQVASVNAQLGLDRPVLVRYGSWLSDAVHGDFGESIYTRTSVTEMISERLPVTLSLAAGGLLFGLLIGVPTGIFAATRYGGRADRIATSAAIVGQAVPGFWLGILLVAFFAVRLGWLPAVGYTSPAVDIAAWVRGLILPSLALGLGAAAVLARQTRSALIGVLQRDYIRTALAKGAARRPIVFRHALRNAAIPLVTVISFEVSGLLAGSIIIEEVFAIPGLGSMAVNAIIRKDPNVILAFVVVFVLIVLAVNFLLDLAYGWLNPKVRLI